MVYANTSFNTIRENKILAKIFEFKVLVQLGKMHPESYTCRLVRPRTITCTPLMDKCIWFRVH